MNGSISQNVPKFEPIKIGSNLKKELSPKSPNLAQNWADWYMNGSPFHEKLVFVWVYSQILQRNIPTKTKLEYHPQSCKPFES